MHTHSWGPQQAGRGASRRPGVRPTAHCPCGRLRKDFAHFLMIGAYSQCRAKDPEPPSMEFMSLYRVLTTNFVASPSSD